MKAQCERCKEIVPFEFSLDGDAIKVHCPSCDQDYRVAPVRAAAPAPEPPPAPADGMACPKCGARQKQAEACRRCGLIIANWDPEAAGPPPPLGDGAALWAACEERWSDEARHEAFIEHCRRAGLLAHAAARYRQAGDRPGADGKLARIRTLAEQSLAVAVRVEKKAAARTSLPVYVLMVVMAALIGAVAWKYLMP